MLQLDVIWTAEFAAAGWILPTRSLSARSSTTSSRPPSRPNRWRGALYALPWFVDVGLLYWRTDLMRARRRDRSPSCATRARARIENGRDAVRARLAGRALRRTRHRLPRASRRVRRRHSRRERPRRRRLEPAAVRALTFMRDAIDSNGIVPPSALTWQEEQVRFAFQNGQAAFMRNWPYAWALLQDRASRAWPAVSASRRCPPAMVGARPPRSAARSSRSTRTATSPSWRGSSIEFLTAPAQMLERAARGGAASVARGRCMRRAALADALTSPLRRARRRSTRRCRVR